MSYPKHLTRLVDGIKIGFYLGIIFSVLGGLWIIISGINVLGLLKTCLKIASVLVGCYVIGYLYNDGTVAEIGITLCTFVAVALTMWLSDVFSMSVPESVGMALGILIGCLSVVYFIGWLSLERSYTVKQRYKAWTGGVE